MRLGEWVAHKKRAIHEELLAGSPPTEGEFDAAVFKDAKDKGKPQMGATKLAPHHVDLEFVFPDPTAAPIVFSVRLTPPERVVSLPVPEWVVEDVWQGEVNGSHQFESHALEMVDAFRRELEPEANAKHFGPQTPKRRE